MKKVFLAIFSFFIWTSVIIPLAQAQGEGNYWYFGFNAGLSFSTDPPTPLLDGQISTTEGCAVISDASGHLLFYTDGITVWDKNHHPTPNGFGLMGDPSSTQSAIIVPHPGAVGQYYIFTAPVSDSPDTGYRYTLFDLSLNGGLGDVVAQQKNILLYPSGTEKITAVRKDDGTGYWVVGHEWGSSRFCAFEVTAGGINMTPVLSNVGTPHDVDGGNSIGYLKISPNGKWLALAIRYKYMFELFDFNATSGVVSNPLPITGFSNTYGVEFSPDNTRLYLTDYGGVYQYDLTAGSPDAILASKNKVGAVTNAWAVQLALNGKIYVSTFNSTLDVIHNPNNLGAACNYQIAGQDLGGQGATLGLPTFIQSFFAPSVCSNNPKFLSVFRKSYTCPDCSDGKIAVSAIGGVKPYQYSIDGVNYQNSGVFNGLSSGVYTVYIRDANGCIVKRTIKL